MAVERGTKTRKEAGVDRKRRRRRPRRGAIPRTLRHLAEVSLVLGVVSAPLMVASVTEWATAVGFGLAALALLAVLSADLLDGHRGRITWPFAVLGAVLAWELLQLVPLPPTLLRWLSPEAHELQAFVLGDLGAWPSWRPLSLDPLQTGLEAARHLGWVGMMVAGARLAESRSRRRRLVAAVALTGVAVVVVGFVHRLAGLELIYGSFPMRPGGWLFSTFVNPNHYAALLDLTIPVCIGLAAGAQDASRRMLWALAAVVSGVGCFLTLSRGGVLALIPGVAVLILLERRRRRRADSARSAPPPTGLRGKLVAGAVPLGAALAFGTAAWLALDPILEEAATLLPDEVVLQETRWALWSQTLPMVGDFWAAGIGRGSFAVVFPIYKTLAIHKTATAVENQPLQAVIELGVPFALALLAALVTLWTAAARTALSPRVNGLAAGLLALGVHELADFSTSFGGVAAPAALAFGLLVRIRSHETRARLWSLHPMWGLGLALLATAAGTLGLTRAWGRSPNAELARLQEEVAAGADVDEAAARRMRLRPTDHMPALVAAVTLEREGSRPARAMFWANRAMYLSPTEPRAHLVAAELLARTRSREQALLEYRLAVEWGATPREVLARAARRFPEVTELRRAVPADAERQAEVVGHLVRRQQLTEAVSLGRVLLAEGKESVPLLAWLALAAFRAGDDAETIRVATRLMQLAPDDARGPLWLGRAHARQKDVDAAVAALRSGLRRIPGDAQLSQTLARIELDTRRDPEAALDVLSKARLPQSFQNRAMYYLTRGDAHRALQDAARAASDYRLAARASPTGRLPRERLGDLLWETGEPEAALEAWLEARERAEGRAAASLDARIERARAAVSDPAQSAPPRE